MRLSLLVPVLLVLGHVLDAHGQIIAGGPVHDGRAIRTHLPEERHLKNVGGSDGAGLCVFASISHAGDYQNDPVSAKIFQWMRQYPGGGYPSKVDAMMRRLADSLGVPVPLYVQHTGGDARFLELALHTGRYPCVTYDGRDGVYYRGPIAHMVNLVYLNEDRAAIHDNNYPGRYLWMTRDQFLARWRGNGGGWAVVLLAPPPPPPLTPVSEGDPVLPLAFVMATAMAPVGQCPGGVCPVPARGQIAPGLTSPTPFPGIPIVPPSVPPSSVVPSSGGPVGVDGLAPAHVPLGDPLTNYGVDLSKIPRDDAYSVSGRPCSKREAYALVGDGLEDDSDRLRLSVVGPTSLGDRVRDLLKQSPDGARLVSFQRYDRDHWTVKQRKLPDGITLQDPSGRVLWTAPDVPDLETLLRWIRNRKIDSPAWPDLPAFPLSFSGSAWLAWLAAVGVILFRDAIRRRLSSVGGRLGGLFARRETIDPATLEALREWQRDRAKPKE